MGHIPLPWDVQLAEYLIESIAIQCELSLLALASNLEFLIYNALLFIQLTNLGRIYIKNLKEIHHKTSV